MEPTLPHNHAPQRVIQTRRQYNTWVVDESIEDYALRYAPKSVRQWSLWTVTNTALAAVSFLAMEALGATMLWQYGFSNAFWALVIVSIIIFLTSWPIGYYAAKYNLDIDLLKAIVNRLRAGELLDESQRDHDLSGNHKGYRECHIQPDWLLVYQIKQDILTLVLARTGTHSDIF